MGVIVESVVSTRTMVNDLVEDIMEQFRKDSEEYRHLKALWESMEDDFASLIAYATKADINRLRKFLTKG